MSRRASLFIAGIILLSMLSMGVAIYNTGSASSDWVAFVVLLTLAIPAQLYEAEHGRQSYYPHFVCFFAAVLLLPPTLFAIIIIVPHIVEWVRQWWQRSEHLRAWYIQPFNIATHLIAGVASFLLLGMMRESVTLTAIVPHVFMFSAAALVYVLVNHLIVGGVLMLARGISFAESRVMTIDSLQPDFILACLGILVSVLWAIDPWWIVLALLPLVLMYQAIHVPHLKQEAETDSKTGLWNARYFTKLASTALVEAQRSLSPIAFVMADLDYLRTINNTHGHLAGDVVIGGIAKIIRETIRDQDIAARFGGEEFTIALPGSDFAGATAFAERLRKNIEKTEFITALGKPLHATISIGVSCYPHDGTDLSELTHAADVAVYYAKFLGRNQVVCTTDVPHATKLEYSAAHGTEQVTEAPPAIIAQPILPVPPTSTQTVAPTIVPNVPELAAAPVASHNRSQEAPSVSPSTTAERSQSRGRRASEQQITQTKAVKRRFLVLFVSTVVLGGASVTMMGTPQTIIIDPLVIVILMGLAILAEAFQVNVYGDNTASVSVSLVFAGALIGGIAGVASVSAALVATHAIKNRVPLYKAAFNWSTHVLAGTIPILIMSHLAIPLHFEAMPLLIVPLLIAAFGYYAVDTGLIANAISLATGARLRGLWHDHFQWLMMHYVILCLIGAFTAIAVSVLGPWGVLICTLPLFLARYAQAQYIDRTEATTAELRRMNHELRDANEVIVRASSAIQHLNQELMDLNDQLFETLARFFDARDPYVGGHAAKVAEYAEAIARELGLPQTQCKLVRQAGYLHDIGKIAIPERILYKPSRLTQDEYDIIKTHASLGADLLEGSDGLQPLARFVRYHHERWDGQGYPHGLHGTEIPIESRILSLCDSVEAMASDRPYHRGQFPQEVMAEIARCAGTQFDPAVVRAFQRIVEREGVAYIVNSAHMVSNQNRRNDQETLHHRTDWSPDKLLHPAALSVSV